jgi:hypothetical protein
MKIIARRYFDADGLKTYTDMRKRTTQISKTLKDEGSYTSKTSTKIREVQPATLSPEMLEEIDKFRNFFINNYLELITKA